VVYNTHTGADTCYVGGPSRPLIRMFWWWLDFGVDQLGSHRTGTLRCCFGEFLLKGHRCDSHGVRRAGVTAG
jgi:hypothetical protein